MKSARKYVLLGLAVVLLAALLSGCSVTVTPKPTPGKIRICTDDPYIVGYVYIDNDPTGEYIDGWEGFSCTDWITVTLHEKHYLEVWNSVDGTTYDDSFTPTYDWQTITIPIP